MSIFSSSGEAFETVPIPDVFVLLILYCCELLCLGRLKDRLRQKSLIALQLLMVIGQWIVETEAEVVVPEEEAEDRTSSIRNLYLRNGRTKNRSLEKVRLFRFLSFAFRVANEFWISVDLFSGFNQFGIHVLVTCYCSGDNHCCLLISWKQQANDV